MSAMEIQGARSGFNAGEAESVSGILTRVEAEVVGRRHFPEEIKLVGNAGCPENTGLQPAPWRSNPETVRLGPPFSIGEVLFFTETGDRFKNAICFEGHGYLFGGMDGSTGDFTLLLSKRSLTDFEELWTRSIGIPRGTDSLQVRSMLLHSLKEENNVLSIELVNSLTHEAVTIKVVIQNS